MLQGTSYNSILSPLNLSLGPEIVGIEKKPTAKDPGPPSGLPGDILVVVRWLMSLRWCAVHFLLPGTQQLAAMTRKMFPQRQVSSQVCPTQVEIYIPVQTVECVSFP